MLFSYCIYSLDTVDKIQREATQENLKGYS